MRCHAYCCWLLARVVGGSGGLGTEKEEIEEGEIEVLPAALAARMAQAASTSECALAAPRPIAGVAAAAAAAFRAATVALDGRPLRLLTLTAEGFVCPAAAGPVPFAISKDKCLPLLML